MPNSFDILNANKHVSRRGPDHTNISQFQSKSGNWNTIIHNLLDISGHSVKQPYIDPEDNNIYLLFNGEIYNYFKFDSKSTDTEIILSAYKSLGSSFAREARGEFVFLIYDKKNDVVDLITDPFLTKPVFIGRSDIPSELGISSYQSALDSLGFNRVLMAEPNTHYHFKLKSNGVSINQEGPIHNFSTQQTQYNFNRFHDCLIESVRLRAGHGRHIPALSLSSGYDSGAICAALNLISSNYVTISVDSGENNHILNQRLLLNSKRGINHINIKSISRSNFLKFQSHLKDDIEHYKFLHLDGKKNIDISEDSGAIGAFLVASRLKENNIFVNLSGTGSDEIYSDYGHNGVKFFNHSEFGGLFPDSLDNFFPWKKFYGDTQRSYLFKEEIIFGNFGIESRYPLLDRELVQEFLALAPELKNKEYKAPLADFLKKYCYPYENGVKRGFSVESKTIKRVVKDKVKNLLSFFN